MAKVGVALPWIGGACVTLFPAIYTSRVVNEQCLRLNVWPNEAMAKVIFHIITFFLRILYHVASLAIGLFSLGI